MRKVFIIAIFIFIAVGQGAAQADWTGVMDGTAAYTLGAGTAPSHSFGLEQFVNLRLRVRTRDAATFNASFNLIAASGSNAQILALSDPLLAGDNYAAAMELERLFVRLAGEHVDTELGLLRMNFGYGMVWGPTDFLNPRNPLIANARPRGVLGGNMTFYPTDTMRLMPFISAPKDPLLSTGSGFIPGLLMEQSWDSASLQAIYAYETPTGESGGSTSLGIHNLGFSLKFDLVLGFVIDALYSLNPRDLNGLDGLSASLGFDYSFFGGDLILMADYLYNGSASVTSPVFGGHFINNHYLSASAVYRINDFMTSNLAAIFCFDSFSFQPILGMNYELYQGFSLSLRVQVPLDETVFGGSRAGELGPIHPLSPDGSGSRFTVSAGARLRF